MRSASPGSKVKGEPTAIIAESRRIEKPGKAQSTRAANASFAITVLTKDRASVISLLHDGLVIPMPNAAEESASGQRVGSADSSAFGFGMTKTKCYTGFAKVLPTFLLMSSQVPNSISLSDSARAVSLTRNQIRGFWASWGGWALDGMDSFIYALVLVPSLRELLPRSGIPATKGNIGVYGGLLFALFLVGWGLAFLWGPIGDKFGRVRTLMLTIAWYSLFTFLSALVTSVWQLAVLRLLAGIGIGGEWAMGGTFVAEEWPEERRRAGAGYMHTGYYFGFFLAALANYFVGAKYGWRWMFVVGGTPALLVTFIRYGVRESAAWRERIGARRRPSMSEAFGRIFSSTY